MSKRTQKAGATARFGQYGVVRRNAGKALAQKRQNIPVSVSISKSRQRLLEFGSVENAVILSLGAPGALHKETK